LILWGVLLEVSLILLIDYVPAANRLFGTAPLGGDVWLFLVPFALALLGLEELRKWFARRMLAGQAAP
ncbi:MAG TPA: cation transporting ATPase C-terminal domain-containing protein, partial [Burkholderiales bacterium]|nr:cation transporting ATPase C-terminal domain-containing protein [Burkholderiales bacterium]